VTGRRRRDGDDRADAGRAPRVRGAWETPAVVVRAPDGSVVDPAASRSGLETGGRATTAPPETDGPHPLVRPRRIPGAVGAALVAPSLLPEAADDRVARRARRQAAPAATVTPLVPRPRRRPAADDLRTETALAAGPRGLRSVGSRAAARAAGRGPVSGRGARRPAPARPGERRHSRVLAAVASIDLGRLAGPDEATRERRRARLRSVGSKVGAIALAGVLLYAIFPVRTYLAQRAAAERGEKQEEVITRENERLEKYVRDLQQDDNVEVLARKQGWVKPGEESYGILPAPQEGDRGAPATTTTAAPGPGGG
jgi:cell division protein FtsB